MKDTLIIQNPSETPEQLVLLFHGVGATPLDMAPLGQYLTTAFPHAFVASVPGAQRSDVGAGYQWFSIQGISEQNRGDRVAEAMPLFVESIRHWQAATGVSAEATALIGFSQGAIMVLESTQLGHTLSGRVFAIAGRFARPPDVVPKQTTLHLIHGKNDAVIPYSHSVDAAHRLISLGADVTADIVPFLGHEVNGDVADLLVHRLKEYLPRRRWAEALCAVPHIREAN